MSDAIFKLDAEVRTDLGKGASRRLRHEDKVPAILYGAGKDPVALTLDHNKVIQAQEFEAFYAHVLTLNIGGEKVEALVKDMQRHAYKPKVTHIDFLRVDANKPVHKAVPIHFLNEENAESIKTHGGHAEHHALDIAITCLPANLPEYIEVDVLNVKLGQTLHLSDVTMPEGVTADELGKGEGHDIAIVTVKAAKGGSDDDVEAASTDEEEAAEE